MLVLKDSAILITGGTGSLGKALVEELLADSGARKIAIFSRDELKQLQLKITLITTRGSDGSSGTSE